MKLTLRSLIAFILLSAPPIHAKGPIGSFLTRALDKNEDFVLGYAQTRHNEVKTNVEERAYSAVDQKLNASLPFSSDFVLQPEMKIREIATQAQIPNSQLPVPDSLYDARARFQYDNHFAGASGIGLHAEIGQATDRLFRSASDSSDIIYNITGYLGTGPESKSVLMLFINFANDRPILNAIPIPGFSYGFRLSPLWGLLLGFPHFGIWAEPTDWLKFELSMEPLYHLDTSLKFDLTSFFQVYLQVVTQQEVYKRAGRLSVDQQLIYEGLNYKVGIVHDLGFLIADLSGGLGVNRRLHETDDYFRDRSGGFLGIGNGFFGQLGLQFRI